MTDDDRLLVGYLRESQARGDEGGVAIRRHKRECLEKAEELGWTVSEWFVDDDESAFKKNRKRSDYERLIALLRTGRIGGILTWDPDRLHRDVSEGVEFIDLMEEHRVEFETVLSGYFDLTTARGRKALRDAHSDAMFESERKSERVRSGMRQQALDGKHHGGGSRPFGYVDRQRSALHPEEAPVIRAAGDLLLGGASKAETVRYMAELSTTSEGKQWTVSKMQRCLTAPSLAGLRAHKGEIVLDEEGKAVQGNWDDIFTEEEHERLVTILTPKPGRARPASYLLSGIAVCGRCGAKMIAQPYRGKRAYRCPQPSRTVNGPKGCGGSRILAEDLDEYVLSILMAFVSDPEQIARRSAEADQRANQEATTRAALAQLAIREDNLADAVVDGLPKEQFRRKQGELKAERQALERQLSQVAEPLDLGVTEGSTPQEARKRFDELTVMQQRAKMKGLLAPEDDGRPALVVRSVTDAGSSDIQKRVTVRPDWSASLARAAKIEAH